MQRLITICAVVGLIMTVTGAAQADLDIGSIIMTSCKDHLDGAAGSTPWVFEVWVEFADEGDLDHIDVTAPGTGSVTSFTIDNGDWEYESLTDYSSLSALQGAYAPGTYTFEFYDDSVTPMKLDSVTLDYSGLSEPGDFIHIISPTHGATDVSTTPTFTWTALSPSDGNALGVWLWDPIANDDVDWDVLLMDATSWGPLGPLDPDHDYDLEVSVLEVKNGWLDGGQPALPTTTTDGSDGFAYGLMIEYLNEIEFTTVPEPATVALLGLGALSLLRRRRRA